MSGFGKVAVLMGGWSNEREISLRSGGMVLDALLRKGVDAHPVDAGRDLIALLRGDGFDRAFIALHGRGGEDGVVQGALDLAGIPYTGSGVLGSAVAMDKLVTKRVWRGAGLPTPEYRVVTAADSGGTVAALGLPLIVKPALEGSSIGMSKVDSAAALDGAVAAAVACGGPAFAERWIAGDEYTCAVLGDRALPLIRLETPRAFYDYEAKYEAGDTRYICPCGLDGEGERRLQKLSLDAFEAVGAHGWGRVDLMVDGAGEPWLIEVNTVPGMTDHSLVPMAAAAAGIDFEELVIEILRTSMPDRSAAEGVEDVS